MKEITDKEYKKVKLFDKKMGFKNLKRMFRMLSYIRHYFISRCFS